MSKLVYIFYAGLNVFWAIGANICSYLQAGDLMRSDCEPWG